MKQSEAFYEAIEARKAGKPPQLLVSWWAANARERLGQKQYVYGSREPRLVQVGDRFSNSSISEYGDVEILAATGRATCRHCGSKISKGETAVKFNHDFQGSGSWTAQSVQIHFNPCTRPSEK